ncbi:hypothetical protein M407DRAFT_119997 [Tulasnella calospora MUT 4182]|uniref:Uncharacterized protein n=1 Tax=Tulasnella calospora MUT 4182 TaxID=1051891 RepID=A0A0C3LLG0_9AGAM|nr:hypothetical protein M407DRAFT_119997 [Tulasnella calospora MUT 4182]
MLRWGLSPPAPLWHYPPPTSTCRSHPEQQRRTSRRDPPPLSILGSLSSTIQGLKSLSLPGQVDLLRVSVTRQTFVRNQLELVPVGTIHYSHGFYYGNRPNLHPLLELDLTTANARSSPSDSFAAIAPVLDPSRAKESTSGHLSPSLY